MPLPENVARTILPIFSGVSFHPVDVAWLNQLDSVCQVLQSRGVEIGEFIKALEVTAAGLDGNEFFQRFEQRGSDRLSRGPSVEGCRCHPESLAQPLDVLSCKPSLPSEDLRNDGLSSKLLGEIVLT